MKKTRKKSKKQKKLRFKMTIDPSKIPDGPVFYIGRAYKGKGALLP